MAGRKGKSGAPQDRMGGIAKAKEAAQRGASERAAERRSASKGESRARDAGGAADRTGTAQQSASDRNSQG